MDVTLDKILAGYRNKKYPLHPVINIFGIRGQDLNNNQFTDLIGFLYNDPETPAEDWTFKCFQATTRPGHEALANPMNKAGTGILKSGFYPNVYELGYHKGNRKHPALVQVGPMLAYRDNDKDLVIDFSEKSVQKGMFGCNLHRAGVNFTANVVDDFSFMCQVVRRESSLEMILSMARLAKKNAGVKRLNYALFLQAELNV